ncbi:ribosomal-processing cysteine protease Prp [Oscillospiraceae bacterium OttesenSCG-928-G22]|nr:ribosomal-processing cysteine protease Prp [Oscillospiraceae bacterium OttesenSCG-928-G22]
MIEIRFFLRNGRVRLIESEGHSGYADEGSDIVCAAVTSAFRLLETQLNDALQIGAHVTVDERGAFLSISIRKTALAVDAIVQGFQYYIRKLSEEYPAYISVSVSDLSPPKH